VRFEVTLQGKDADALCHGRFTSRAARAAARPRAWMSRD
jgi:hypothetical protein